MSVLKYLFAHQRTLIYLAASCILTVVFSFLTGSCFRTELFFIFFLLLMMIRIADDTCDYLSDKARGKTQELSKEGLLILYIAVSALFTSSHLYVFGYTGLISLLYVAYVLVEERIELMQRLLMFLLSCYYFFLFRDSVDLFSPAVIVWTVISLIFPVLFSLYKRRKRK